MSNEISELRELQDGSLLAILTNGTLWIINPNYPKDQVKWRKLPDIGDA